ncbi:MAG: ABC transporter permease [Actinomycetales bacterium]|nr:ABC transporter permease [Actinomycetales bacterium]
MTVRRTWAVARFEFAVLLRNPEQLLLTLIIPMALFIILTRTDLAAALPPTAPDADLLALAGTLGLALFSTAFTAQAIATGFERRAGMLRLLATSPASSLDVLIGKAGATIAMQTAQILVLMATAIILGVTDWATAVILLPALIGVALLTTWSTGTWGLILAGTLRAEAVLAVANAIWLATLIAGGLIVPAADLGRLGLVVQWLPTAAIGDLLRLLLIPALDAGHLWPALIALLWGAAGAVLARNRLRWV